MSCKQSETLIVNQGRGWIVWYEKLQKEKVSPAQILLSQRVMLIY